MLSEFSIDNILEEADFVIQGGFVIRSNEYNWSGNTRYKIPY